MMILTHLDHFTSSLLLHCLDFVIYLLQQTAHNVRAHCACEEVNWSKTQLVP